MVPESGIERRQNLGVSRYPSTGRYRGGAICLCSGAIFCCFLFGRMGHWNRDRDCEPANCLSARGASFLLAAYRAQNPASVVNPFRGGVLRFPSIRGVAQALRNNSVPPKWSKLWTDAPKPGDRMGAYTPEQFEQMNLEFTAAVERAFRSEERRVGKEWRSRTGRRLYR